MKRVLAVLMIITVVVEAQLVEARPVEAQLAEARPVEAQLAEARPATPQLLAVETLLRSRPAAVMYPQFRNRRSSLLVMVKQNSVLTAPQLPLHRMKVMSWYQLFSTAKIWARLIN